MIDLLNRFYLEECLLSCFLKSEKKQTMDIIGEVKEEYFSDSRNKYIFSKAKEMYLRDKMISLDILSANCKGELQKALNDALESSSYPDNWEYYSKQVWKWYCITKANTAIENFDNENIQVVEESIESVLQDLSSILVSQKHVDVVKMSELSLETIKTIEKNIKNKDKPPVKIGLTALEKILYEFRPEYYVIGARTSLGKSSLAWAFACKLAEQKIKTQYISLEMSPMSLSMREVARSTGISLSDMQKGYLETAQLGKINNSLEKLHSLDLYITEGGNKKLNTIIREIRRAYHVDGVRAFFIDHASKVYGNSPNQSYFERFQEISGAFQDIQRELGIYIFVIAQLGRDAEQKAPSLSDIRGAGAFEEDADVVMLLHRERIEDPNEESKETEIRVIKNRNGTTGKAHVIFEPHLTRFRDITVQEQLEKSVREKEQKNDK